MKSLNRSVSRLFVLGAVLLVTLSVNYLRAFNGPPGTAPDCPTGSSGCDAPINSGDALQEKSGGLKVESLWATTTILSSGYYFNVSPDQLLYADGSTSGALQWSSGNASRTQMMFRNSGGILFGKVYGDALGANFGLVDGDNNWSYKAVKDDKTQFFIDNAALMTILANGKVGVGTDAPEARLDVAGDIILRNETPAVKFVDNTNKAERNWMQVVDSSNMIFRIDRNGDGKFNSEDNPSALVLNSGALNASKDDDSASFANDVYIGGQLKMNFGERLYLSKFDDTAGNNNIIWADNNGGYNVNIASRGKHILLGDTNAEAAEAALIYGKKNKPGYDYSSNFTQLFNVNSNGLARSLGGWGSLSDARSKTNVAPITDPLQKVEALNGVTFDWKDTENHPQVHDLGLIAQEVQEVLPEVVYQDDEDMDGMLTVDYGRITAVLIEAVKELSAENDELEARIAELEAANN